jgi:hypothetical protein
MASTKDIFEANIFEAGIFAAATWRGVGASTPSALNTWSPEAKGRTWETEKRGARTWTPASASTTLWTTTRGSWPLLNADEWAAMTLDEWVEAGSYSITTKYLFRAGIFKANTFASGTWRGVDVVASTATNTWTPEERGRTWDTEAVGARTWTPPPLVRT